ncbi:MAG: GNAT family N-acetyltransferase [Anaerolineae bacterium]|nr:GNAT family N-acetyltransferase [Anaerolineae bacterium]
MSSDSKPTFIRPVKLTDARPLQMMCWPDRSLDNIAEMLQRAEKLVFNRRGLGVVAERAGTACAFGLLTLWPRTAEISDLIIHEAYRGQGIGSQIITYLELTARKLQAQILEIGVALANPRALALYRRLGFEDHHTIKIDLGDGPETVLYLYKSLH